MRTPDDLREPERFDGLGEKVTPPAPPPLPEWRPRAGAPGIEENAQGQLRTTNRKG